MVKLELDGIVKHYDDAQGSETAVKNLSLTVENEMLVLLGPSGCGKTTTLRMIAGLEEVTEGSIRIGERDVTDLRPSRRSIAMAFQDFGLYTTMNVRKNIGYGLKHSTDLTADERTELVEAIAEKIDISELLDRDVSDLSGGQKQRVSLGRAIVREPDVFLLDEPLASLDAKLRSQMRTELQQLQSDLGITTVYVTHDQKEAMTMADKIAILDSGVLKQLGPPEMVYDDPTNEFVADFLGSPAINQFPARVNWTGENVVLDVEPVEGTDEGVTNDGGPVARFQVASADVTPGQDVTVGVRPEYITLDGASVGSFDATVIVTEYQGNENFVHLKAGGHEITAIVPPQVTPDNGDVVSLFVPDGAVHVFDGETGTALRTTETGDSVQPISDNA